MKQFLRRTVGILLCLNGILVLINPIHYSSLYEMVLDFTDVKWLYGGGLIAVGAFILWSSFRKKVIEEEQKKKEEKKIYMCPQCIKPFYKIDCKDLKCPNCQAPLEELSGFYERHPELKGSKNSGNIPDSK